MAIKRRTGSTLTLVGFVMVGCLFSALTSFLIITFSNPPPPNINYLRLIIDNENQREIMSHLHKAGYIRLNQKGQDEQQQTTSSRISGHQFVTNSEVAPLQPVHSNGIRHQTGMANPVMARHIFCLDIPKAGTSFFDTAYLHFCPQVLGDNPVERVDKNRGCYDEQTNIQTVFHSQDRGPVFYWPSHRDQNLPSTVMAMFRDPYLRARSAFIFSSQEDLRPLHAKDANMTFQEYVQMPEIRGCQVAMVAGNKKCEATRKHKEVKMLEKALDVIDQPNFFFGITDRWGETMCLFHKWFGGTVQSYELENNRETTVSQRYKRYHHRLDNVKREMYPRDDMDMIWFQKVEEVFDERLKAADCFGKQYKLLTQAETVRRKD